MAAGNLDYQRVKGELELKSHSLKLLQERSEKSESHQLAEAVAAMEAELTAAQVRCPARGQCGARNIVIGGCDSVRFTAEIVIPINVESGE